MQGGPSHAQRRGDIRSGTPFAFFVGPHALCEQTKTKTTRTNRRKKRKGTKEHTDFPAPCNILRETNKEERKRSDPGVAPRKPHTCGQKATRKTQNTQTKAELKPNEEENTRKQSPPPPHKTFSAPGKETRADERIAAEARVPKRGKRAAGGFQKGWGRGDERQDVLLCFLQCGLTGCFAPGRLGRGDEIPRHAGPCVGAQTSCLVCAKNQGQNQSERAPRVLKPFLSCYIFTESEFVPRGKRYV
jgi:hypothetical protein